MFRKLLVLDRYFLTHVRAIMYNQRTGLNYKVSIQSIFYQKKAAPKESDSMRAFLSIPFYINAAGARFKISISQP